MDSHAALACGWDGCVSRVQIPLPPIPLYTQREKGRPPLPSFLDLPNSLPLLLSQEQYNKLLLDVDGNDDGGTATV